MVQITLLQQTRVSKVQPYRLGLGMASPHQVEFMRLALEEAKRCEPTPTAFCVGCVIVPEGSTEASQILSTGFSRELPGNTHAEANALSNARAIPPDLLQKKFGQTNIDIILQNSDVYCTMEPCSVRMSGLPPCVDALIAAKVKRCWIGTNEPADFVRCEGVMMLMDAGIGVSWISELEADCLTVARRGHPNSDR
jgi:pyrimidine deaminase RibD-like protein